MRINDNYSDIKHDTNTSQGNYDDKDYNEDEDEEDDNNKNEKYWDEEDGDSNNDIHDKHNTHEADNTGSIAYQMNSLADVHQGASIESSNFINVSHNVGENQVEAAKIEFLRFNPGANGSTL
ncbi:hypothetical protein BY996DRAFT_6546027 [Phakopsora pachyrhizi]|uniref:Uncharacterized protein n=1 Tax=Phakopsora pachyrhizi TaxID=170000 RepID=A0AAV0BCQ3_PHAPC|nr:hypothetical protein BY996DRAFT_6508439 [Phakopsora pachyrhizi]KAI8444103.1 hypothetical protein BY996DRAFT_6546027 [Phakopsora pachyrhizi]CAH7684141.1 hypothetical protein PPACK8108_LOCUS18169 [Phakopsora pachyrhizi]